MREPGLGVALPARTGADPEAQSDRADGGHHLRHDSDAGLKRRQLVFLQQTNLLTASLRARAIRVAVADPPAVAIAVALTPAAARPTAAVTITVTAVATTVAA